MAFDLQLLLPAVLDGKTYIRDFTYKKYESAFSKYKKEYGSVFARAIDENEHRQMANDIYHGLEQIWLQKRWGRKEAMLEAKMMITLYLTPMLLEFGAEGESFAVALCQTWRDCNSNDKYEVCTYDQILKSFRRVFLGFDLGRAEDKQTGFNFFRR